jgi:hypothetical protein
MNDAEKIREKRKLEEEEITKVDDDVTDLQRKIASVSELIDDRAGRIKSIEETIIVIQQKLQDEPAEALRDELRSLTCNLETLQNEIRCFRGDHTLYLQNLVLLRQKEDRLLELLILNKKAMTVHERAADPSIIYFKFEPCSASSFTAGKSKHCSFCLYNADRPVTFNHPEIIRTLFLLEVEVDTKKSAKETIIKGLPRSVYPEKVSETQSGTSRVYEPTIEQETGVALNDFFSIAGDGPRIICASKITLESVGSSSGPATENSNPDGLAWVLIAGKRVPLGCFELIDFAFAPIEQTGQAFASGANLALSQLRAQRPRRLAGMRPRRLAGMRPRRLSGMRPRRLSGMRPRRLAGMSLWWIMPHVTLGAGRESGAGGMTRPESSGPA